MFDIFQPVVIFFDSAGVPIYQTNGVLEDWQIEAVLDGFAAATASAPVKEAEKATPPAKEPGNHCATISEGFVTLNVDTHHDGKGNSHGYLQGC